MIGCPMDFRHVGHMGADDLESSYNVRFIKNILLNRNNKRKIVIC